MRRSDREVKSLDEIEAILRAARVCHLSMVDAQGRPYCVPLNFGLERHADQFVLYFHAAGAGRKLEILRENPQVCATVSLFGEVLGKGSLACDYTMNFASVMGFGTLEILKEDKDRQHGLEVLMGQLAGEQKWQFAPKKFEQTTVMRLPLESVTAKQKGLQFLQ